MPNHWLQTINAKAPERKFALIIAGIATCIVAGTLIWSLMSDESISEIKPIKPTAVKVIEKPESIAIQEQNEVKKTTRAITQNSEQTAAEIPSNIKQTKKPAPIKKKVVIGQGHYFVQVGAFKKAKLAKLMHEKMTKKYKRAKIIFRSKLYVVWVGPVVTYKEAETLKQNLQRRENIKGFIISDK